MKLKKIFAALLLSAVVVSTLPSCKSGPKDEELKAAIETSTTEVKNWAVNVEKGAVTLSGEVKDDATKTAIETSVKAMKGVKSVANNLSVTPPPAPVVISADDTLRTNLTAALTTYSTVKADVMDGVVTLTGDIEKKELPKLMQAVMALKPKKVDNKLTIK